MVCGYDPGSHNYEYKLPDRRCHNPDVVDDAVNSNSIVLFERYSRRRSIGASSTSSDDDDECRIVAGLPGDGEMEADDRYLQNLGRKVSMIAAEASQQAQVGIDLLPVKERLRFLQLFIFGVKLTEAGPHMV